MNFHVPHLNQHKMYRNLLYFLYRVLPAFDRHLFEN